MAKSKYRVTMRVDIDRIVYADSEDEALEIVDEADMMYELKKFKVDTEMLVDYLGPDDSDPPAPARPPPEKPKPYGRRLDGTKYPGLRDADLDGIVD